MMLKVLGYNICLGGSNRLAALAEIIRVQRPDAVALVEATDRAAVATLARDLRMQPTFGDANNGVHLAWLSRLPVHRRANHRLPTLAKTLLEIEVPWGGASVRLFATHLASRHDATTPADEVPAILTVLRSVGDQPHLLIGDFNALRPGDPVGTPPRGEQPRGDALAGAPRRAIGQLIDAAYTDCYRTLRPRAPGYTYPAVAPWLRLDYAFASPRLAARLAGCDVVMGEATRWASDHLPIWVEFHKATATPITEIPIDGESMPVGGMTS